MGTQQTRIEKLAYVQRMLNKSKENKKGFSKKMIIGNLMVLFNSTKNTANEILQAFIDSGKAEEILEEEELVLYG